MNSDSWFEDVQVLGSMPPQEAVTKLQELGEETTSSRLDDGRSAEGDEGRTFALSDWVPFKERACCATSHAFGYLAPRAPGREPMAIVHAGNIEPDMSLQHARVKIVLNRLRVADYPGSGMHRVLFDFYAKNQLAQAVEHLHFNSMFRVNEGEEAAVIGYPIFVGLSVGSEGLAFKCFTVNVKNDADEAFLSFLDSEVFRAGLKLSLTAQPAIAPLGQMAIAITKSVAKRNRNVAVQDFYMGLDFTTNAAGARLAEGDYIAVQVPQKESIVWDWEEWAYSPSNGQVVRADTPEQLIPYNYVIFGISRYEGP